MRTKWLVEHYSKIKGRKPFGRRATRVSYIVTIMTGTYPDIEIIGILGATEEALGALEYSSVVLRDANTQYHTIAGIEDALMSLSVAYKIIDSVNRWAAKETEKGVSVN